jgi:DNA anti-recombination protein RmuC
MTIVTNELIFRALKQIGQEFGALDWKMQDINGQIKALGLHSEAMRQDVQNIDRMLARQEARLDRIERRLEITQVPG